MAGIHRKSYSLKIVSANNENLNLPAADVLVAAAFYLMTSHARTDCPLVRRMVVHQLRYLARHPSDSVTPMLRDVCIRLAREWERLNLRQQAISRQPAASRIQEYIH